MAVPLYYLIYTHPNIQNLQIKVCYCLVFFFFFFFFVAWVIWVNLYCCYLTLFLRSYRFCLGRRNYFCSNVMSTNIGSIWISCFKKCVFKKNRVFKTRVLKSQILKPQLSIWIIVIVGGKDLSFCVELKVPFANSNAFEEEKVLGKAP